MRVGGGTESVSFGGYIKNALYEGLAAHFNIFVWRIPWTEEPGVTESDMTEMTEHVELLIFLGVIMILWL